MTYWLQIRRYILKIEYLEMPFTKFKAKAGNIVFVITAIGAIITLIGYMKPVIEYASTLNKLVTQYEAINASMAKIERHIAEYDEDRANKKKTFSIGLRSDVESGQIIYVDENNGIYRVFLNDRTKEYFYYDAEGNPIYCYTRKPVRQQDAFVAHTMVLPIHRPDTIIVLQDSIQ